MFVYVDSSQQVLYWYFKDKLLMGNKKTIFKTILAAYLPFVLVI